MANIVEDLQRGTAAINSIEAALKAKGVIGQSEEVPVEDFDNRIEEIGASNIFRNSNILCNFSDSELEDIKYILPNEWDEEESYLRYDICSKDGVIYQAIATPTLGIFEEYEWTKVDLVSYLGFLSLVSSILPDVSIYSQGDRYYIGQYVIHGGRMYRCDASSSIVASTASPDTDYFYMFSYTQYYRDDLLQRSLGSGLPTFDASESYDQGAMVAIDGSPVIFYNGYTANDPSTFYGSYVDTGVLIAYINKQNKQNSNKPLLKYDLYINEFNDSSEYNLYDTVYHNEYYYYLSTGPWTPGPFDGNYWTQVELPKIIEYRIVEAEYSNKLYGFDNVTQYYPNDLVFGPDGLVYQFRTAHLGEWDPDDVFIRFSIDDSISQLMHWANLLTIDTTALNTFDPTTSYTAGDVVVNLQGIPVKFTNNYTANDISTYSVEFASEVDIAIYLINSHT